VSRARTEAPGQGSLFDAAPAPEPEPVAEPAAPELASPEADEPVASEAAVTLAREAEVGLHPHHDVDLTLDSGLVAPVAAVVV